MADTSPSDRRRDYMVNRRVQLLYMLTWMFSLLLVVSFAVFTWLLWRSSTPLASGGVDTYVYLYLGAVAFLMILCALTLGVYIIVHTHRMMGSAYRIGNYLSGLNEGIGTGNLGRPLTLRDGDFFAEVADEVNTLRETLVRATEAVKSSGSEEAVAAKPAGDDAAADSAGSAGGADAKADAKDEPAEPAESKTGSSGGEAS